jgi:hypothetical protein
MARNGKNKFFDTAKNIYDTINMLAFEGKPAIM